VSVPVHSSHAGAVTGGSPAGEAVLAGGDVTAYWLGPVPEDKLPKDAQGVSLVLLCWLTDVATIATAHGNKAACGSLPA
jgi:hypothetical protein